MACIFIVKIKYDGQTFLENKVPDLSNALYNCRRSAQGGA